MQVIKTYSHLNGHEYLTVHKPKLLKETMDVISSVDATKHRTKISEEKTIKGKKLYSPTDINKEFRTEFRKRDWHPVTKTYAVTSNERLNRKILGFDYSEQKKLIEEAGAELVRTSNETDFVKDRVAVEVQLGKYSFVAYDLFVKHMGFFVADVIDIGVEIVPMKEMERHMSSGPPYFENEMNNVIRQGRGIPAVPLVMFGVAP